MYGKRKAIKNNCILQGKTECFKSLFLKLRWHLKVSATRATRGIAIPDLGNGC